MSTGDESRFQALTELICQVKPSLSADQVTSEARLIDDLGLDSLDLLQLSRKIARTLGIDFDLDTWDEGRATHRGTVQSVRDQLGAVEAG